jgi:hypothetical protein
MRFLVVSVPRARARPSPGYTIDCMRSTGRGRTLVSRCSTLILHPMNVLMHESAPVVIDWSNARVGPSGMDVATTALILAQVVVTDGMLASEGIEEDDRLRSALADVLREFTRRVSTPYAGYLSAAEAYRRQDAHQSATELEALPVALDLAASVA